MRSIQDTYQRWYTTGQANYIPGLDGVRAISVMLVILAHAGFGTIVPGGLGVTIFFFVSGLLITNLLCTEFAKQGRIDIKAFYVRRYLRLSPELYLYVAVCTILSLIVFGTVSWLYVAGGLFYFMNYLVIFQQTEIETPFTTGHLWSLAVEEHFYLTYPLLLVLTIAWPKRLLMVLIGICLFSLGMRMSAVSVPFPNSFEYTYYASEARLDSIAYGCIAALLGRVFFDKTALLTRFARTTFAIGAVLMLLSIVVRHPEFRETIRYSMQGIALLLCATAVYGSPFGAVVLRVLERPSMRFIGQLSYGIYLWHFMPMQVYANLRGHALPETMGTPDRLAALVIGTAFSVAVAYPSLRFVLGAVSGLRRRFGSHGTPGASPDPAPDLGSGHLLAGKASGT